MKRLNRSHFSERTSQSPSQHNKSYSEASNSGTSSLKSLNAPKLSPREGDPGGSKCVPSAIFHLFNKGKVQEHEEKRETYSPLDDYSFVKERMVELKIKRAPTPHLELPPPEGEEVEKTPLEIMESQKKDITCYSISYILAATRYYIQTVCLQIAQHSAFEAVSLLIILANCVILSLDDPTTSIQQDWQVTADYTFQALYTLEIVIKVLGMGFAFNKGAYIRDPWNILDFTIVVFGYLSLLNINGGVDLKALRTFRVLRPLRTISSVEGLKILMNALVTSLPLLFDTLVVLMFFFIVFAIAGLQLWHGILKKRCFDPETGTLDDTRICGYYDCDPGWVCVEGMGNPNYGATHFDDVFTALLTVFQCVTLEGWTDTQLYTIRAFGPYAVIFYTPLVLIGAFFLVNFTLAVIKSRVTDLYKKAAENKGKAKSEQAIQDEAEKKLSMGQILRQGKGTKGEAKFKSKMLSVAQRLRGRKLLKEAIDRKIFYNRVLGFDDLEDDVAEAKENLSPEVAPLLFSSSGSEGPDSARRMEKAEADQSPKIAPPPMLKKKTTAMQKIHDDVIKEVDESPLSISSITGGNGAQGWNAVSEKFAGNFKKSLGMLAGTAKPRKNPIKLTDTQIEYPPNDRKVAFSGILGIKAAVTPQIKVAFGALTINEDLDEFTDALFAQGEPFQSIADRDKAKRDHTPVAGTRRHLELSSSMLDIEESRFQATPKEASNPRENISFTPRDIAALAPIEEAVHQSHTFGNKGDTDKVEEEKNSSPRLLSGLSPPKPMFPLKEQGTMGTAASSSVSSSLVDHQASKLHKLKTGHHPGGSNMKADEHLKIPSPDKSDRVALLSDTPPAIPLKLPEVTTQPVPPENTGLPDTSGLQPPHTDEDAELKVITEKFVFQDGEISTPSAPDVVPRRFASQNGPVTTLPQLIAHYRPPYKLKVNYVPTELPEEEEEEPAQKPGEGTVGGSRKDDAAFSAGESSSTMQIGLRRTNTISVTAKGKKKKKSKKGKKKGKKGKKPGDSESKASSGGGSKSKKSGEKGSINTPSAPSITVGSKGNVADTGSVADSAISGNKKKGPEDEEDPDKKDELLPVGEQIKKSIKDESEGIKKEIKWSGQEVLLGSDPYAAVYATSYLQNARVWGHGWKGKLNMVRYYVKCFVTSAILENIMNLLVMVNTITLAMDRYGQPASEDSALGTLNIVFTGIFTAELVAKIFSMGIVKYLSDSLNYLDFAVVIFSLVEVAFLNGQGALSAFRSLRIFRAVRMIRTLRVLRVARLLRSLRSMQMIIEVIGETIGSFAYIGLLLMIFIFIYALFGMQLFGGQFNFSDGTPRQNFDSFNNAFLSIFQVLTMENWQSLLYACMRAQTPPLSAIYLVTWIFIGNYILLNLFLAIMLDAFSKVDEEMGDDDSVWIFAGVSSRKFIRQHEKIGDRNVSPQFFGDLETIVKATSTNQNATTFNEDALDAELATSAKAEAELFKNVECSYSLYLFSKENWLRILCWNITTSDYFETVILGLICIGSIKLAVDSYFLQEPNELHTQISFILDLFFTISFALEALLKIVSLGFVIESGSYLRDSWNQLDFFIVVASLVDQAVTTVEIPMIKVLRLFRTFRPLRFVTHNVNMRVVVTALFKSLGAILNTLIVVLVIWLMFSIVGVNFFSGKFQYCTVDTYNNSYREDCLRAGGQWRTYDHNFDNSLNGLIFLFVLTTQENWPVLVYQAIDCTDVEQGPTMNSQWYYGYFFVIFLFVGSMFLLNLFVGVMFLHFTRVQKHETSTFGDILITEQQLNWIEVQKMIIMSEPNYNVRTVPPTDNWRKPFHDIVTSSAFEWTIAAVIMLNMVQMGMLYDTASEAYLLGLEIINYIFTGIFTIELILKLFGFGWDFWYETWNVFDMVIVVSSYIDIIFSNLASTSLRMLRIGPQLLRILRVLRVSRLLRLVKKYQRLQEIMEIIQLCLPSMMNVFSLLTLVLFIYAVLGCYLFGDIKTGDSINDFYNFSNFGMAMVLCLKLATGEDWNKFMFDCARTTTSCAAGIGCGNPVAFLYFLSFKLVVTFIMLNLFILVVLQLFEKYFLEDENIVNKFKEDYQNFQDKWQAMNPTHSGFMISQDKLRRFFSSLTDPMGMEGLNVNEMTKEIIDMGIRSYGDRYVFFNELLFRTMKRQFFRMGKINMNDFMKRKEYETQRKIQNLAERALRRGGYQTGRKTFLKAANPFVSLMIIRVTFKLWRKYKNEHNRRVQENAEKGFYNYESSMEEDQDVVLARRRAKEQEEERKIEDAKMPVITPTQLAIEEFTNLKATPRKSARKDSSNRISFGGVGKRDITPKK